ncbi:hypothetical protein CANMA_004829 [Candida margitis]|uniref:uncharacterized protein n=1 Tax=Candida margitis TaxID=1775924 RepID=UPI0022280D4C|nr:uncharacterized protein CANMA_004829 [Candida margitis]KAI5953990.1 hypothetical protein CANMA_004829 [Candida margitis]
MKSFIKQPKKNDSTTFANEAKPGQTSSHPSNFETMNRPPATSHKFTPTSSPKLQQYPQYTPPVNVLSASSTNSPKKLLTPIKNLFTSTKSAGPTPNSNDNLQSLILNGASPKESKSSRFRKHIRSRSHVSVPTINDFKKPPEKSNGNNKLKSTVSSPSLQKLKTTNLEEISGNRYNRFGESSPLEFVDVPPTSANMSSLGPPISLSRGSSKNVSIASLAESEKFHTREVFFDATSMSYINDKDDLKTNHTSYSSEKSDEEYDDEDDDEDEEEDDDDDDNSSQFSFVQDMKGGRNTSVKYYKTNVAKPKLEQSLVSNPFDEQDLGHDDVDMSDYDFENNGLGDEDDDFDDYNEFDGENAAYNEMFQNDDSGSRTVSHEFDDDDYRERDGIYHATDLQNSVSAAEPTFGNLSRSFSPETKFREFISEQDFPVHTMFNSSHHLSIQGPTKDECSELPSSPGRANIEEDILENYLDPSISNSIHSSNNHFGELESPVMHHEEEFELFDVSSPVINGLTIGHNLGHRSNRMGQNSNRSLIHRNPINMPMGHFGCNNSSDKGVSEGGRYIVSFHGSFDDSLNNSIKSKLDDFENWSSSRQNSKLSDNDVRHSSKAKPLGATVKQSSFDSNTTTRLSKQENGGGVEANKISSTQNNTDTRGNDLTSKQNRSSVVEMMGLLSTLQRNDPEKGAVDEAYKSTGQQNRNSVAEMMGLLSSLEDSQNVDASDEGATESNSKEVRSSVAGMMNFLASVGEIEKLASDSEKSENGKPQTASKPIDQNLNLSQSELELLDSHIKRKPSFKRYSWFSSQESLTLKGVDPTDDSIKPPPLDQDILDEINQIPEDYDYDEQSKFKGSTSEKSFSAMGFERSSSFNRKPKKVVMMNQVKPNKVETLSKTVTFYDRNKAGPSLPLDVKRVKSSNLSRGSSFRSITSIPSVTEVNEDEEESNGNASVIPVPVKLERPNN